jgi:hypothetical protein
MCNYNIFFIKKQHPSWGAVFKNQTTYLFFLFLLAEAFFTDFLLVVFFFLVAFFFLTMVETGERNNSEQNSRTFLRNVKQMIRRRKKFVMCYAFIARDVKKINA